MAALPVGRSAEIGTRNGRARLPRAYLLAAAVLPLILVALLAVQQLAPAGPPEARIGDHAPAFSLTGLGGQPVSLADLRGRPVIVNFWASWCGPCIAELPLLRSAAATYAADGLAIVGVVFKDREDAARAFEARMGVTWPAAMDPGAAVATAYGVDAPPASFFVNRDGVVAGRQIGQLTAADLQRQLGTILDSR